jgi:AAA+ superfamily predicted ATPase
LIKKIEGLKMSKITDYPSPREMSVFQRFYENIKAIQEQNPEGKRYDRYLEFLRKDQGIKLKRGTATDILLFLMEKYINYEFNLHFVLPVISIRGVISEFKLDSYKSVKTKDEYENIRKSSVTRKGFLYMPDTWNSELYVISLGLKFFEEIMGVTGYPKVFQEKVKTYGKKFISVDPFIKELNHYQLSSLGKGVTFEYIKIQRAQAKLENKLPQPKIGKAFVPERGLEQVILPLENLQQIKEVITFINNIDKARKWGIPISPRIILAGEVGTGKTLAGEGITKELERNVYSVSSEHLVTKYIGDMAINIDEMFKYAEEHEKKSILIIEEIEGLLPSRSSKGLHKDTIRAINTFLASMEEKRDIIIIGTTNRPNEIDSAALSRFSMTIWFDFPTFDCLKKILYIHFKDIPNFLNLDLDDQIINMVESKFTGRNIRDLSVACGMIMLVGNKEELTIEIFSKALKRIKESKLVAEKSIAE